MSVANVVDNAKVFATRTWSYEGGLGQRAWILHRLTGLGVFAFLALHIIDIFVVGFNPAVFNTLSVIYHLPVMRMGHIILFYCVIFHAVNGVRIIILDLFPHLWRYQKQSIQVAMVVVMLLFIPSTLLILYDTLFVVHH